MSKYIIKGGKKVEGEVVISGSKNSALPIIAASILNAGKTTLYNVPKIHDVEMMFKILERLGGSITKKTNKTVIDTSKINKYEIPEDLMRKMRSSVIFVGSLIGKYKKATFSYPGGCDIGTRPIDLHLKAFEKMNININKNYGNITCTCDKINGEKIHLDFPSVGATENIMLLAVLSEGKTEIINAAREPEIIDLQNFLNKMGAKIIGAGSSKIEIEGVKKLKEISYNVMPDRIEAGTFLTLAAINNSNLIISEVNSEHLQPVIDKLEEAGCKIDIDKRQIKIKGQKRLKAIDIRTMPYPGFPTDMQSIILTSMTIARGTSMIVENIFENRYKIVQELVRMGAKIKVEGNMAIVKGVRKLYGTNVKASDLRGGAALVLAGTIAKGETVIDENQYIKRGYENFLGKLKKIGVEITEK